MLKTIQAGRGLAAIAVAAFHLSLMLEDKRYLGHRVLESVTWHGNLGVDFFFVLSGFIIVFAHSKDIGVPERWRNYVLKRFVRVYPIYWIYVGAFAGLVALGFGTVVALPHSAPIWFSTVTLIRLLSFKPLLAPAWTLFHEIAFYAVFSTLIVSWRYGLAVMGIWLIAILAAFENAPSDWPTPFQTYFSLSNLDFFIGIGAYLLWRSGNALACQAALGVGLVVLIVTGVLEARGLRSAALPLIFALSFGGILAGAAFWEERVRNLSIPIAVLLGNASYTIYLTHEAFEGLFGKIALKLNHVMPIGSYGVFLFVLGGTILSGCMAYLLCEKPLLSFLRAAIARRRQPVLAASYSSAGVTDHAVCGAKRVSTALAKLLR